MPSQATPSQSGQLALPPKDSQFAGLKHRTAEIEHRYGPNVHLLADPYLLSHLAHLCAAETHQPMINELVTTIYQALIKMVVNAEFPLKQTAIPTRMIEHHPEGVYQGPVIDPEVPVICVNLARAGTLPSHICYTALNYFMNPKKVRQDHVSIARQTDSAAHVTGSHISGHKIGGATDDAIVLFPDPMGATGSTLVEALNLFKKQGKPRKCIALHCIVTPEYLKYVQDHHPDLVVYAVRLDRGLSAPDVLASVPGTHWEREKGLNPNQYIVPGGGGFGEILNNAYV